MSECMNGACGFVMEPQPLTEKYLIMGTGQTGLSFARFLSQQSANFDFYDTREPAKLNAVALADYPQAQVFAPTPPNLADYQVLLLSPGISIEHPLVLMAKERGLSVWGDIELFARQVNQPVIAITGSNGKSTVTSLVGHILQQAGVKVAVGGNLGKPALDLIAPDVSVYVLEISSFQMESVESLKPFAACVLNVSPDHLDRHGTLAAYAQLKLNLLKDAAHVIYNRQDPWILGLGLQSAFGTDRPRTEIEYGLVKQAEDFWCVLGEEPLMPVSEIPLQGLHNWANVLAAWALIAPLGVSDEAIRAGVQSFEALEHRCQFVAEVDGVLWINDSKATNIGAMETAIKGFGEAGRRVVLLAGGQGKAQDFSLSKEWVARYCDAVLLFGEDAPLLEKAWTGACSLLRFEKMADALVHANASATAGQVVLLSPACASFDQFSGYAQRGTQFMDWVKAEVC